MALAGQVSPPRLAGASGCVVGTSLLGHDVSGTQASDLFFALDWHHSDHPPQPDIVARVQEVKKSRITAAPTIAAVTGGLRTDPKNVRRALWPSLALATIGVIAMVTRPATIEAIPTIELNVAAADPWQRAPAERWRFSGGRDSETGSSGGTHVAHSERWRSRWDHEFESPLLQRRV